MSGIEWDATRYEYTGPRSQTAIVVKTGPHGWTWSASVCGRVFATGGAASSSAAKGAARKALSEREVAQPKVVGL